MHRHPLSRWLLLVVLLINGTVTASAWAINVPVPPAEMSAHCADAMAAMAVDAANDAETSPATHQHDQTSDGCCAPGSCHCASSTLPGDVSLIPQRAPLLHAASIAPRDQRAAPAPALTRHFRPPIR